MYQQLPLSQQVMRVPTMAELVHQEQLNELTRSPTQTEIPQVSPQELERLAKLNSASSLRESYLQEVVRYNDLANELHKQVGVLFMLNHEYSRRTHVEMPCHEHKRFREIHVPMLLEASKLSPDWTTTAAAIENFNQQLKWE